MIKAPDPGGVVVVGLGAAYQTTVTRYGRVSYSSFWSLPYAPLDSFN